MLIQHMTIVHSDTTTDGIRVQVHTWFLADKSSPARGKYVFGYRIRISNLGSRPAKLVSRHWIITDSWGVVQEVKGEGVVGEQPRLEPGQAFEYTSFCPLSTPRGTMRGTYRMVRDDETSFEAEIGTFHLTMPGPMN